MSGCRLGDGARDLFRFLVKFTVRFTWVLQCTDEKMLMHKIAATKTDTPLNADKNAATWQQSEMLNI